MFNKEHPIYLKELIFTWVLLIGVAVYVMSSLFVDHRDPIHSIRYEPQNSPLVVGEDLILRIYREKVRDDCPITSVRRVTSVETGVTVGLAGRIWNGGSVDASYVDIIINTSILDVGQYVGIIETRYDCPRHVFTTEGQFLFTINERE